MASVTGITSVTGMKVSDHIDSSDIVAGSLLDTLGLGGCGTAGAIDKGSLVGTGATPYGGGSGIWRVSDIGDTGIGDSIGITSRGPDDRGGITVSSTGDLGSILMDSGSISSTSVEYAPKVVVEDVGDLEYGGHKIKEAPKAFESIDKANSTIRHWKLEGVDNIEDLKKAPKAIMGVIMGAVTKIAMHRSTMDVAFKFETQVWHKAAGRAYKSMDRPAFMMALAYDALGFEETDIDNPTIKLIFGMLRSPIEDLDKDVAHEIARIEKKAIAI